MAASPSEIINVLNLLIANDKGRELKASDIFKDDSSEISAKGLKVLHQKARPYVSFVRGYNPISFPIVLEVDDKSLKSLHSTNHLYVPHPKLSIDVEPLQKTDWMKYTKIINCPMSYFQYENYLFLNQKSGRKRNVAYKDEQNLCGFIYPLDDESGSKAKEGFYSCFRLIRKNKGHKDHSYMYQQHCRDFLQLPGLCKYSSKYAKILQNILKSPGIAFVFFENIEVGVETMAMILDAHGYEKDGGGNYLSDHGIASDKKRCAICNQERKDHSGGHDFKQARYVVLQHQDSVTINSEVINRLKHPGNRYGEQIKVILGSPVTRESVDFANVRQIHLASAWFNMSKISQIIGRGVRNCSHYYLKPHERNVVVFRYCVSVCRMADIPLQAKGRIPKHYFDIETGDEYLWRTAEHKDLNIKKIERELKMIAFDCPVTRTANVLSSDRAGSRECDYMHCNYRCLSKSTTSSSFDHNQIINQNTSRLQLQTSDIENVKFYITRIFKSSVIVSFEEILKQLKYLTGSKKDVRHVSIALDEMIGNSAGLPEIISNKTGDRGYLIYRGGLYAFQPLTIKDRRIPSKYRMESHTSSNAINFERGKSTSVIVSLPKYEQSDQKSASTTKNRVETGMDRLETVMKKISSISDNILKNRFLDVACSVEDRIMCIEYLIEHDTKSPLISYFKNFLLNTPDGKVYGHFLSSVPRCLTSRGWSSCSLQDIRTKQTTIATLYNEPDADFVGYMQMRESGFGSTFKIINNTGQRDKTRLDLEVALNTLTKGKTCITYDRVILNYLAKKLGIRNIGADNKVCLCNKIEYAFRERQLEFPDGKRYFYNAIETEAWIEKNTIKKRI